MRPTIYSEKTTTKKPKTKRKNTETIIIMRPTIYLKKKATKKNTEQKEKNTETITIRRKISFPQN